MSSCQILEFDCPSEDLCAHCGGDGNEPITPQGADPCAHCDWCFDEVIGWSTGIEPGSPSQQRAREFVEQKRNNNV